MNSDPTEADRRMETVIDAALGELPLRPAPPGLETRVLEELSRRAALPWWQRSFAAWPTSARVGFVLMGIVLVGLAFLGGLLVLESLGSPALGVLSMPWARHVLALVNVAAEIASLARIVPPTWVYQGLAVSVVLYAALFGLGIAAYRTLYLDPNSQVILRS